MKVSLIFILIPSVLCFVPLSQFTLTNRVLHDAWFASRRIQLMSMPTGTSTFRLRNNTSSLPRQRFERTANNDAASEKECILEIDGSYYNLTLWAKAHPGGAAILHKFHNKDASKAFHDAGHSVVAYKSLQTFRVQTSACPIRNEISASVETLKEKVGTVHRIRRKLFTREDPVGIHKYMGIFCLLHYAFRFLQMFFGDISAGFGSRCGKGPSFLPVLCLLPHAILSLSSLIFHTVPRERVVGKPMIWQEFRVHNILFGMRSIVCCFLAWLSLYHQHSPPWRRTAVVGSCLTSLMVMVGADQATARLRQNNQESTTATMPYWEGCNMETQKRFKVFYAYSQFMASLACISVANPVWGLAVLLAIQGASFLMTLVRKGLLSPKGYHIGYTLTLVLPYYVGYRSHVVMGHWRFPAMMATAALLFQSRQRGISKYVLWVPLYVLRIACGDKWIPYEGW